MAPKSSAAAEGPRALCAAVECVSRHSRCSPWVRPCQMEAQRALAEGSRAQWTAAGPLGRVPAAPVQQQSREVWKASTTSSAAAGVDAPSVYALVQVKAAAVAEALATLTADVECLAGVSASMCTKV